jgi:arylsulfatase A-like enzyme
MPAPDRSRPNILLVTLDQLRADCLGVAGHPVVRTPTLDRLAAEGVRFANHVANCAPCAPGRASLLTGLWQMNHRVLENGAPLADDLPMLPRLLRDLGYRPTLFGNSDTTPDTRRPGGTGLAAGWWAGAMDGFDVGVLLDDAFNPWAGWLADNGVDIPDGNPHAPADVPVPPGRGATWRPARYLAGQSDSVWLSNLFCDWLDHRRAGDTGPWCAHLSYFRPHPPYIAPAPYHDMYNPADVPPPIRLADRDAQAAVHPFDAGAMAVLPSPADPLDQAQLQATYYGMVTEVDAALGRVIDRLEADGVLDDTVVVVTSDHGEQLGDHWLVEKVGYHDPSFRIPLIVRWPAMGGRAGRVVEAFTESVDVLPTVVELCGGTPPSFCDGASLVPFLDGDLDGWSAPPGWRDAVVTEYDFRDPTATWIEDAYGLRQDECGIAVLRDRHGKYVHFAGFAPLLFDLDNDPGESRNLADDPACAARVADYAQRLLSLRMRHADARLTATRVTPAGTVVRPDLPRPHRPPRSTP